MRQEPAHHFKNTDEMLEEFAIWERRAAYEVVVTNPRIVADMVGGESSFCPGTALPPRWKTPSRSCTPGWNSAMSCTREIRPAYRRPAPCGAGRNSGQVDVGVYVCQKAGAADLENGIWWIPALLLVFGGLYGGHHRGELPAAHIAPKASIRICHRRQARLRRGYAISFAQLWRKLVRNGFDIPFETFCYGAASAGYRPEFSGEYQARATATREMFGEKQGVLPVPSVLCGKNRLRLCAQVSGGAGHHSQRAGDERLT